VLVQSEVHFGKTGEKRIAELGVAMVVLKFQLVTWLTGIIEFNPTKRDIREVIIELREKAIFEHRYSALLPT